MFVKKTFDAGGTGTPSSSGQFTADANLKAYFGGDDVATSLQHSISGTVMNFMHGGEMIDGSWMVDLNKAAFGTNCGSATPACDDTNNIFKGTTNTGDGQWQGQFIGPTADDAMPSGVAGEFNGHFTNGHVIGAFGATVQEE